MPYSDLAKQREAQAAYQKRKQRKTKDYVNNIKESTPCADCGKFYPYWVMQFDHVRGEKLGTINQLAKSGWMAAVKKEIEKCEVVCANCHADRTYHRANQIKPL